MHLADIDEVVAAAAGAQLPDGLVPQLLENRDGAPLLAVEERVVLLERQHALHPEGGVLPQSLLDSAVVVADVVAGRVEEGERHAAADVEPHSVGEHGVAGGQHAAHGKSVARVRVRHQRARHGDGQPHGGLHLPECQRVDEVASEHGVGEGTLPQLVIVHGRLFRRQQFR